MNFTALALAGALSLSTSFPATSADQPVAKKDSSPAQEAGKPKPTVHETVVVTATRGERATENVPASVSVVPEAQLQASPAAATDDVLRTVVGLNVPSGSSAVQYPDQDKLSMRGLGGSRALVLLDGIPAHDPYFGFVQWNKLVTDYTEQVEVVRGASASLYGNYAMGGTINMITRPVTERLLTVRGAYGSNDTRRYGMAWDQPAGEKFGLRLAWNGDRTDGYYRLIPEDRGAIDVPSWSRNDAAQLWSEFRPTERFRGFARLGYASTDLSQGTEIAYTSRQVRELSGGTHLATGTSGDLSTTFFYQNDDFLNVSTSNTSDRNTEWLSSISDIPSDQIGGSVQWSTAVNARIPMLSIGADIQQGGGDERRTAYNRTGAVTGHTATGGRQQSLGAFGQASWTPVSNFELLLSARVNSWKNSDGYEGPVTAPVEYQSRSSQQFDPRVSVRYALSSNAALRGAAYRAFRAPTIRELYRTTQFSSYRVIPNASLEPETLTGGEIGGDLYAGHVSLSANAFYNVIDSVITRVTIQTTPSITQQLQNVGQMRSQGFELMASSRLSPSLWVDGGYTWTDSVVTENPGDPTLVGKMTPDVPKHAATLSLSYRAPFALLSTVRVRSQSEAWFDTGNTLRLDPRTVFDLSLSQPLRHGVDLTLAVENLFDQVYLVDYTVGRRRGQPRQIAFGLRFRQPL